MKHDDASSDATPTADLVSFDFDEWSDLARRDPVAFEQRRRQRIEAFIRQAPASHQRRLRGVQFRVELERARARSPLGACVRLSRLMWDSLLGAGGLQERLVDLRDALEGRPVASYGNDAARPSARVLPFPHHDD